ncbi:hypothetical protein HK097_000890 [Rhizophlyctis rosea]|uniref:Uncharacterized protein n=1 Tax=Rhizophlyctis rosea TaxID=64517 RepID=A0AAD5X2A6_9FUNG|nr:hypothetical protein HK097_000890 [Rhizophlyctis rosea]
MTPQQQAAQLSRKNTPTKVVSAKSNGLDKLNDLDVKDLKRFIANLRGADDPLRDLAEYLDKCATDLHIGTPLFGSKNFILSGEEWEGPLPHVSEDVCTPIVDFLDSLGKSKTQAGLTAIARQLIEAQKRATASGGTFATVTIGHQLIIQLIPTVYPCLFVSGAEDDNQTIEPAVELMQAYRSQLGNPLAVGHSLLWILAQQQVPVGSGRNISKATHSKGVELWFKYFGPLFDPPTTTGSDAVGTSVQIAALDYLDQSVQNLEAFQKQRAVPAACSIPFVKPDAFETLLYNTNALASKQFLNNRKRGLDIQEKLLSNYRRIKHLLFGLDAHPRVIVTVDRAAATKYFLGAIQKRQGDGDVVAELLDVLLHIFAEDARLTRASRPELYPSLLAWYEGYGEHLSESQLVLGRLLREQKSNSKLWKQINKAPLHTFLRTLRARNQKILKGGRRPSKDASFLAHIQLADRLVQELLTRVKPKRSFLRGVIRKSAWVVLLSFLYYSIVHVACGGDSNRYCPLSHPSVQSLKTNLWDSRVVPAALISQKLAEDHLYPGVSNQIGKLQRQIADPFILPHYNRYIKPQYDTHVKPYLYTACAKWKAAKESKEWETARHAYFVPYADRVKREWHDAAVFFVDRAVPKIGEVSEKSILWVQNEAVPTVVGEVNKGARAGRGIWDRHYPTVVGTITDTWIDVTRKVGDSSVTKQILGHPAVLTVQDAYQKNLAKTLEPARRGAADLWAHFWRLAQDLFEAYKLGVDFFWRVLEGRVGHEEWADLRSELRHAGGVVASGAHVVLGRGFRALEEISGFDLAVLGKFNDWVLGLSPKVVETYKNAKTKGREQRRNVSEGVRAATAEAKKIASSMKKAGIVGAKTVVTSVKSAVTKSNVATAEAKKSASSVKSSVSSKATSTASEAKKTASSAYASASSKADSAAHNAAKSASAAKAAVSSKVCVGCESAASSVTSAASAASAAAGSVSGVGKRSASSVSSVVSSKINSVTAAGQASASSVKSAASSTGSAGSVAGAKSASSVSSAASSVVSSASVAASKSGHSVASSASAAANSVTSSAAKTASSAASPASSAASSANVAVSKSASSVKSEASRVSGDGKKSASSVVDKVKSKISNVSTLGKQAASSVKAKISKETEAAGTKGGQGGAAHDLADEL